ncbi:hypothetical protein PMAC_000770 [Pneumocystis sp. 'macacae']|nr:hypothetical protein PMAC_000770 [Pneumocystis sp. 'macacae']
MEENQNIKEGSFRMSSYFEGLWRKQTAQILNSFFGIPFVHPSATQSAFILMDDSRACSGENGEKGCKNGSVGLENGFGRVSYPFFMRSMWFPSTFFDWMIPSWDMYMMPGFFRWGGPEHTYFHKGMRDMNDWNRMHGWFIRPMPFFSDSMLRDMFEVFEDQRIKDMEAESIPGRKDEGFGVEGNLNNASSKHVVSVFTKKMSRTFTDGSYETVEVTKKCFSDGTCETTEYTDSSDGRSVKRNELLDNKGSSTAPMDMDDASMVSTFDNK